MDPAMERFWRRNGRYYVAARYFYHHLMSAQFTGIGLEVIWIEKFAAPHHVWQIKAKLSARAQAHLLLVMPCSRPFAHRLLERQPRVYLSRMLRAWGPKVPMSEIVTVKNGRFVVAAFIWKRGRTGRWNPKHFKCDPWNVSLAVRR